MAQGVRCAHCGSENVRWDALAEWDEDEQQFVLHSTYDDESCGDCEAEGHSVAEWFALEPLIEQRDKGWWRIIERDGPGTYRGPAFGSREAAEAWLEAEAAKATLRRVILPFGVLYLTPDRVFNEGDDPYEHLFIARTPEAQYPWLLVIGNQQYPGIALAPLETILMEWARGEGYITDKLEPLPEGL